MKLSVVIPTHNRAKILTECLKRLAVQHGMGKGPKGPSFEVIIVDDGSADHTDEAVKKLQKSLKNPAWTSLTYIQQKASHQGVARNRGVRAAKGKVVVFIGDDILPEPDFLIQHHDQHDHHQEENVVVLGLSTWDPALGINDYMRFLERSGWQFGYGQLRPGAIAHPEPYKFFYTSNISIKRAFFHKERFDEDFREYGWEDIEMGYRLWKNHSMKMIYEPRAFAYHHHFMHESDLPRRMRAVGASAVHFEKLQPGVHVVPKGLKATLIRIATLPPCMVIGRLFGKNFHYKLRCWREFMAGVRWS